MESNQVGTKRDARTAMLIAGSVMVAFLAMGCGRGNKERAAATTGEGPIPASETIPSTAIVPASAVTQEATTTQEPQPTSQVDVLPPDVAASVADSLAIPGEVIEITAMASSDASSVILTDALGAKYPFTYDSATSDWRVSYRVPIKIHTDRLGLSVTATNGGSRFKRVWVFLPVQGR
jgi:hypothetical protein